MHATMEIFQPWWMASLPSATSAMETLNGSFQDDRVAQVHDLIQNDGKRQNRVRNIRNITNLALHSTERRSRGIAVSSKICSH
jgi:hypothetical protein